LSTDNSHIIEKVNVRIEAIKDIESPYVLECYAGKGVIWDIVKEKTGKEITILRIEKDINKGNKVYLPGDNLKYLSTIDLSKFDIIDLDAYGIPFKQCEILFKRQYKGITICTVIFSMYGSLNNKLLKYNNITDAMIKKTKTIFFRNGFGKFKNYLYICGVRSLTGYYLGKYNYFFFKT